MSENLVIEIIGDIEYRKLSKEYLDEAANVVRSVFLKDENVTKGIHLAESEAAQQEYFAYPEVSVYGGISIIAVDKTNNNKVAGVVINRIEPKVDPELEKLLQSVKESETLAAVEFLHRMQAACNLYEHCHVDCILDCLYLATLSEYRGRGIARKLVELTVKVGRQLADGINVKHSIDGLELSLEPRPQLVSSIFTSFITQRIGRQLGFEVAVELSYEDCYFKGQTFASVIGKETPSAMLEFVKL